MFRMVIKSYSTLVVRQDSPPVNTQEKAESLDFNVRSAL